MKPKQSKDISSFFLIEWTIILTFSADVAEVRLHSNFFIFNNALHQNTAINNKSTGLKIQLILNGIYNSNIFEIDKKTIVEYLNKA